MKQSNSPYWAYKYPQKSAPECGWPLAILGGIASLAILVGTMWLGYWAGF